MKQIKLDNWHSKEDPDTYIHFDDKHVEIRQGNVDTVVLNFEQLEHLANEASKRRRVTQVYYFETDDE